MRSKLYKLAVWYIGKCNAKWDKPRNEVKTLDRLTYWQFDKYMLFYGADAEWQNFSRYDVLDNAIQRLAKYEDEEQEIKNKAIDEFAERLRPLLNTYHDQVRLDKIAEQMKGGVTDAE